MKKPLHMLTGVNIGDYEFVPDTILDVVRKYKFGKENGDVFKFDINDICYFNHILKIFYQLFYFY